MSAASHVPHSSSSPLLLLLNRATFDEVCLQIVSFVERLPGFHSWTLSDRPAVSSRDLSAWEREHAPLHLPADFKQWMMLADGLEFRWSYRFRDEVLPLGLMHINRLAALKRIRAGIPKLTSRSRNRSATVAPHMHSPIDDEIESDDEQITPKRTHAGSAGINSSGSSHSHSHSSTGTGSTAFSFPCAFELDAMGEGVVALVFFSNTGAQIWFQDLSCAWTRIAPSFTDYMRLMVMHLGLPRWQYALTAGGLDPAALPWFQLLCPQRLAIDIKHARRFKQSAAVAAAAAAAAAGSSTVGATVASREEKSSTVRPINLSRIDKYARSLTATAARRTEERPATSSAPAAASASGSAAVSSLSASAAAPSSTQSHSQSRSRLTALDIVASDGRTNAAGSLTQSHPQRPRTGTSGL
jgi:tubulin polyglutamylase complex subunit 2